MIRIYILKNKNNYKKHQEIFSQCFIFLSLNLIIIYIYNIFSLKIHLIYTIYPIFPFTNAPILTINIITIKATIIAGPDGILKIYENNNQNNIPKNENNIDKYIITLYFFAIIAAVACGIVKIEIIRIIPIVFIFIIIADEIIIIIK